MGAPLGRKLKPTHGEDLKEHGGPIEAWTRS